jgi:hypothetical protein
VSFRLGSENPSILKERSRAGAEVDLGGSDLCGPVADERRELIVEQLAPV